MASSSAGTGSQPQPSGIPSSMIGFGPSPTPLFGASDGGHRYQYYSSQPSSQPGQTKELKGRRSGKVKFFDSQKGFGFINDYRPEELGNEEVFVHYTSITAKAGFRSLAEGEEAEYEIVRGPKGFQASNVTGPGGQQVMGDTRSRTNRQAFMQLPPYAAMYPYIQQDPSSFYAAATSPYHQAMMLMPHTAATQHSPAFRQSLPYPGPPPHSPYTSPISHRPYDISKDFANMGLSGMPMDDGARARQSNPAPFGGMFGSLPGFDGPGLPAPHAMQPSSMGAYRPSATLPVGARSSHTLERPGASLETPTEKTSKSSDPFPAAPRDSPADRLAESQGGQRPGGAHSRSSSLLYGSKSTGTPAT